MAHTHTRSVVFSLTSRVPAHCVYLGGVVLEVDDSGLDHLVVQVVSLAGALPHPGEHRVTTVGLGHVVDQLHDQHGLAHAGTAEQTWKVEGKINEVKLRISPRGSLFAVPCPRFHFLPHSNPPSRSTTNIPLSQLHFLFNQISLSFQSET